MYGIIYSIPNVQHSQQCSSISTVTTCFSKLGTNNMLRTQNEYFRPVSLSNRKSCPHCKAKLSPGESIWSWGEYVRGQWRTVRYFCRQCYPEIQTLLIEHKDQCGCSFQLKPYSCQLPEWLTIEEQSCTLIQTASKN